MDSDSDAILCEPPVAGDETETLLGALERQRRYLAWKCGNLDPAGMRATLGPSAVTLGGLVKHLALVEDDMFSVKLHGRDRRPPWNAVDWNADPDWEWRTAAEDSPGELMALWRETVDRSRTDVAQAIADGGLDRLASITGLRSIPAECSGVLGGMPVDPEDATPGAGAPRREGHGRNSQPYGVVRPSAQVIGRIWKI